MSTLRTGEVAACLLLLLASLMTELVSRGGMHVDPPSSASQTDVPYTWESVEKLIATSHRYLCGPRLDGECDKRLTKPVPPPSYPSQLFSAICKLVQTLNELCDVDSSLLQVLLA